MGWTDVSDLGAVPLHYGDGLSVAADHGEIFMTTSTIGSGHRHLPGTLLIQGSEAGSWADPVVPRGLRANDVGSRVAVSIAGHLTLAYEHCQVRHGDYTYLGKIKTVTRKASSWTRPNALSKSVASFINGLTTDYDGKPVVVFDRIAKPKRYDALPCTPRSADHSG